jgi:hypothetical protein
MGASPTGGASPSTLPPTEPATAPAPRPVFQALALAARTPFPWGFLALASILAEDDLYRLPIALQALIVALAFLSGIVVAAGFFMTPSARTHWQELHGGHGGGWLRFAWISANTVYVWTTAATSSSSSFRCSRPPGSSGAAGRLRVSVPTEMLHGSGAR